MIEKVLKLLKVKYFFCTFLTHGGGGSTNRFLGLNPTDIQKSVYQMTHCFVHSARPLSTLCSLNNICSDMSVEQNVCSTLNSAQLDSIICPLNSISVERISVEQMSVGHGQYVR